MGLLPVTDARRSRGQVGADEVRVWVVSLDVDDARRARLESFLSDGERERAYRYLVRAARDTFVVARGTLRELLGYHSGFAPEELRFSYPCLCGRPGCIPSRRKPRLEPRPGLSPLSFSVSHTGSLALIAVAARGSVGIDVERCAPDRAFGPIARRAFSAGELAAWEALPPAQRLEAFYRGWTRKEAYVKARGCGFALPPAEIEVSLAPSNARALRRVRGDAGEAAGWRFHDVPSLPGHVAALAVDGDCVVRTAWWPPDARQVRAR
jgi:4'-phosphopantetheinyl transferase